MIVVECNQTAEFSFASSRPHRDPFNEVDVDVLFTGEDGVGRLVPAFWAGGDVWRVRFSSPVAGGFQFETRCSDESDSGLHHNTGEMRVIPYAGDNPLLLHGRLRTAENKRHLVYRDGTPFFWLADTWWMGLTRRLTWPQAFQTLALDRLEKGFNAVQIVAGLYPDMAPFDERGENEAGFPWLQDCSGINPAYFDFADRRVRYLVDLGIVPCVVGCWGYYLLFMGVEKIRRHWRYLVARWGSYPVVWCLAGEATMPYYLSQTREADQKELRKGWTDIARFVRSIDPFGSLLTVHPTQIGREQLEDPSLIDFDMLQTGHSDTDSLKPTADLTSRACRMQPRMPFINAEVCYEGILDSCAQEVQRLMFWVSVLNGACGHTYGANGIWQVNTRERPYGPSPHGGSWGDTPWEDAFRLPGSSQLGASKRLLEELEWWRLEPHPEWVEPRWDPGDSPETYMAPYAAGVPGKLRIIYLPSQWSGALTVRAIEPGSRYRAILFDPVSGRRTELGAVAADSGGSWRAPAERLPRNATGADQDWVLVLRSDSDD